MPWDVKSICVCVRTRELKSWACQSSQSSLSVYRAFSVTQSTGPFAVCCVRALTIRNRCWPTLSCTKTERGTQSLDGVVKYSWDCYLSINQNSGGIQNFDMRVARVVQFLLRGTLLSVPNAIHTVTPLAWLNIAGWSFPLSFKNLDKRATDPEEAVEADGHPVGQQLLHRGLCAS